MSVNILDLGSLLKIQQNLLVDASMNPADNSALTGITNNLNRLSAVTDQGVEDVRTLITHQADMQKIADTEQAVLEKNKQIIEDQITSKKREIELTENYKKRVAEYNKILMIIVIALVAALIVNFLKSKITMIPGILFDMIVIIIISVASIMGLSRYYDIQMRSPSNFDELITSPPTISNAATVKQQQAEAVRKGDLLGSIATGGCVGRNCCDTGTKWDEFKQRCIEAFSNITTQAVVMPYSPSEYDLYAPVM